MSNSQSTQSVADTDFNRFLSARFAPREKQHGLLLICALDAELEKIAHQTADPMLRRIRTQFWRDALYEQEGAGHWLARDLIQVFADNETMFSTIDELIVAHENTHETDALSATRWVGYCERQAVLFKLACAHLVEENDQAPARFYHQCGSAYGRAHFLCVNLFQTESDDAELQKLQHQAKAAYTSIVADLQALSPFARVAVLPLALVPPYLDLFQASDNADSQPIDLHPARKAWILWRAIRKGFK